MPYARETAMCVDLALDAVEADVLAELDRLDASDRASLTRVLSKLRDRRKILDEFTRISTRVA